MSKGKKNILSFVPKGFGSRPILIVFTALSLFWAKDTRATHAMGGDIYYECIGVDLYRVVLNFYRDCDGIAAPNDCSRLDFRIDATGCGGPITGCFEFESVESITPICYTAADLCNDPSGTYGVEWYVYADTIDLSGQSGCGDDWLIEWDLQNRNNNITSLVNAGSEQLYISALLNNTLDVCNNSPVFLNDPTPFSCVNAPINYDGGVSDPDGDSLVFSFAPARGGGGALLAYSPGYSFTNPILTAGGADAPAINPVTGTITAVPNQVQFAVVTVLVQEYRDQVLIGEFTRDVQFAILPASFCNNEAPLATGINGTTDYELTFCADSSFCFDIFTSDANAGDSIYVSWNGGIAGATFTVGPGLQPTATFCWATSSADIGTNLFSVILEDNSCELNGITSWGYALTVTPPSTPADAGPDQIICATSTTMAGVLPFNQSVRSWSLVSGAGTINNTSDPTTLITGLGVGDNVFEWAVDYENCGVERDTVVITVYDISAPAALAGVDQNYCLPTTSANLSANTPAYPAVGTWSVTAGGGTVVTPNDPASSVTGLTQGLNTFEWSIDNGPCGVPTTDELSIFIFDNTAPAADAGIDQEFCSPTSTTNMAANTPLFPATGNWILLSGTGTVTTPTSPTSAVTGLSIGDNVFRWEIDNGPCAPPTTDTVSIFIYDPAAPAANAGVDIELCTPVTSTSLAGNLSVNPAVGTWTLISGSGTLGDPNDPTSLVTGLAVGENIFEWTIYNGPCNAPTTDQVSVFLFDAVAPVAAAGPDQDYCTPTNTALMAANTPLFPATGSWSLVAGTGIFTDATDPNTTVTGITVGVNTYRWSISNGPCPTGVTQDDITVSIYDNNTPMADAGPDQNICTPTSTATLTGNVLLGPATGLWTNVSGTGNIVQPTNPLTQITGLAVGENVFQWAVDNGPCNPPTTDLVSIFIFDANNPVADAGADQSFCLPTTSTNLTGNAPIFPATGTWSLISGGGTLADPSDPTTAVTALPVGENIFEWTMDNGPCATGITTDQVSIFIFDDNNPIADAGPDQELCTPITSTSLAGNAAIIPAVGTWSVISGSGSFSNVNDPNATVSGLAVGDNIFQWSMNNGPCTGGVTTDQVSIFLFDLNAAPASAGVDVDLCSPLSTYTMTANTPTSPAIGTWTVISGTGNFSDANSPVALVSGMSVGENVFQWEIDNGICGISTDQMSIFIFDPNAAAADAGPDVSFCTPTSTATMAANSAVFPGSGQWVLISGGGTITDNTDPNTSITALPIGENIFQWTIDNGPCPVSGTSDLVSIFIYDQNAVIANAGPDQEFCTPTSSATLAGSLATFPAVGTWSLVSGTGTVTQPGNPFSAVTGLTVGENIFEWTMDNGPCPNGITTDQVSIFIYDATNPIANAGPDQEFCTPTSSATLAGNSVIFPSSGTWTVIQGTGIFNDANDPTTDVIGLSIGENILQWEVDNGPCGTPTTDEVSIFIFDGNALAANAGPDEQLCTPTTSTSLSGNVPVFPGVGTWSLLNGTGTIADVNDPASGVTGLSVGENIFEWSIDNGPCGAPTTDQVSIFLFDQNASVADAGPDQSLCTPTTFTNLSGNVPDLPGVGTWSLINGTGIIADVNDPATGITGLTVGENIFEWSIDNGPCGAPTTDQVSIFIFDQNAAIADAGIDQELCTPTTSTNLSGNVPDLPGIGTWTLINGTGVIADVNDPVTSVSGLTIGENVFEWSIDNGPCGTPTTDQVSIFIFDQNAPIADAGLDQDLCLPTTFTTLGGNTPTFPGIGTWTLLQGTGSFTDANDPITLVTGLTVGENVFEWSIDNGPCAPPTQDTVTIFIFDNTNANADAGPDQDFCTPTSSTSLAGNIPTFPASGTWSLIQGTGVIADANDPTTTVTGLTIGENIFVWQVDNGPCANGTTTDEVSIFIFDENSPVSDAGPDQQICTPNSSVTMAGSIPVFPSIGTWTLISGTGLITDPNDPTTDITGLPIGTHVFVWTVDNGPCATGISTDTMVVEVFDVSAGGSDAGPDQEFCLPATSTSLFGNVPVSPAIGTWALIQGTGVIADVNDPTTAVTGLTVGENIFEWTITNGACNMPIGDQVSIFIFDDTNANADAGTDQSYCTPTSTTELSGNMPTFPAIGTWTLVSGSGVIVDPSDQNTTVNGLTVGENIFEWSVDNGPCANGVTTDQVSIFIYDENMPEADAGPDQEFCTPISSTTMDGSSIVFPGSGMWSLVSGTGTIVDSSSAVTSITGLTVGENIFVWEVDNGPCLPNMSSDTVSIFIFDENAPVADAGIDQEICTPIDSALMAANVPVFPAIGTWTLLSGTGTPADPNDPNTWVYGLTVGENVFEWATDNGPCIGGVTTDVVSIFLFETTSPPANAGPDQNICMPQDFATMAGNVPIFPGEGTWSLVSGAGLIADVNDPTTDVTSLAVGENVFVWEIYNGPCGPGGTTRDTVSVFLFDSNSGLANAGIDQELCTPIDSTTLDGNIPVFPSIGVWTLVSGTGDIADTLDPATSVTGLTVGENIFEWTVDNGPCSGGISTDQVSIFLFSDTAANADAGADQSLCTPSNSTVMAANVPLFPATGMWSLSQGTGTIIDATDPSTAIQGLSIGENIFEWTIDNGPCANGITSDFVSIFVYDSIQPAANAGPDQDLCTPTTSTTMAGSLVLFPATGTWSLISGGATINDPNDPVTLVTGLVVGENIFVWTIDNGPCNPPLTSDTVSIFLFDEDQIDAMAGPDQDFCSPLDSTTMLANAPTFPAIGTWVLLNGAGTISDVNDPFSTISDLGFGENVFEWQMDNGPCGNVTSDVMSIFLYDSSIDVAYAGEDQLQCQDSLETFLEADPAMGTGTGSWSTISGTGIIQDASDPNTLVTDLEIGDHIFVWTVDNGTCGSTADTIVVTIRNCVDFVVPDAFSPNGDGTNDVLEIPNIQYYPNNEFQVFNRWGSLVYEAGPYMGDWDGRSKSGLNTDKGLPEGTYYYILDLGDGSEVLNGFIYLRR